MEHDPVSSQAGHKIHVPVQPEAHTEQVQHARAHEATRVRARHEEEGCTCGHHPPRRSLRKPFPGSQPAIARMLLVSRQAAGCAHAHDLSCWLQSRSVDARSQRREGAHQGLKVLGLDNYPHAFHLAKIVHHLQKLLEKLISKLLQD